MTDNFDWQKDEENGWIEADPPIKSLQFTTRYKRFTIAAGLLLLILIPIVVFSLYLFQRRIEQVTDTVESEIKSTHLVLLEAVNLGDFDLIDSFLPDEDPQIRETLLDQIDRHLLIDRKPLGLISDFNMEDVKNSPVITITTSPDFTFAEVKSTLPYRISSFDEPNNLVNLVLTLAYRLEGERWVSSVLSEESDYWGEWVNLEEDLLTMTVPSLDADVAQDMLADLNQLTKNICHSSDVDCPSAFHLEVHFDRQQESINRLSEAYPHINIYPFRDRYFISMPTPTIVGRPIDAAGHDALYQGYASWLATSLIGSFADLPEEEVAGLNRALLQQNGLEFPPSPRSVLPRTPADLRSSIADPPSEDLLMLCSNRSAINLLRLDIKNAIWSDVLSTLSPLTGSVLADRPPYLTAAPEHQGAFIHVSSFDEGHPLWQSYWWQDSNMLLLIDDDEPYDVYPPAYQKDINRIGRFVRVVRDDQSGDILELTTSWFDLRQCLAGPCEIQKAAGYPIWSPEGEHTLAVIVNPDGQLTLYRGDENAQPIEYLGLGSSPFWISDSTFGFVRPAQVTLDGQVVDGAGQEIAVGQVPENSEMGSTIHHTVHTRFLQKVLPADTPPRPLQILSVMPYPRDPTRWIIAASSSPDIQADNSYLFALDIDSQELKLILDLGEEKVHLPMRQSPNGQFLVFVTSLGKDITFYIRNYASGRVTKSDHSYPVDWTDDGRWLLFFESEKMVLFSPDTDQVINIPINMSGCYSAVFISEDG